MELSFTDRNLPYSVPSGYFDSLEARILARIAAGTQAETKANPAFSLPQTYFDKLAITISNRIALEEVSSENEEAFLEMAAPILYSSNKRLPFIAPVGYFDILEKKISTRIQSTELSDAEIEQGLINLVSKTSSSFQVPQDYFEDLENEIRQRIAAANVIEELEDVYLAEKAPMLSSIKAENPFGVPVGYFKSFDETVLNKISPAPIQLEAPKKGVIRTLTPYFAVSVSIAAAFVIYFGMNNGIAPKKDAGQMAKMETAQAESLEEIGVIQTADVVQYDEYDLIDAVSNSLEIEDLALNPSDNEPSKGEMIDYLLENDIDIHSLEL